MKEPWALPWGEWWVQVQIAWGTEDDHPQTELSHSTGSKYEHRGHSLDLPAAEAGPTGSLWARPDFKI